MTRSIMLVDVAVPVFAKAARHKVEERMQKLQKLSNDCKWNYPIYHDKKIGIITSGGVFEYAREVFEENASYLKLGFTNPLPTDLIVDFAKEVDQLYIIEENDTYLEDHVKSLGLACLGKEIFPYTGEMTPDVIRKAILNEETEKYSSNTDDLISRPPTFCPGCPHRAFFLELGKRKDTIVAGDIGCYSLAFTEPYNSMDWILCMGGSFSTGHGAWKVLDKYKNGSKRVVSVLGDSTFFHTGINSLLDVVYNQSNTINVILDNRITGMTGGQDNPGTGLTGQKEVTEVVDIEKLVIACGIKHVKTIDPNIKAEVIEALNWAYALDEPSVIITKWPCVLKKDYDEHDKKAFGEAFTTKCEVVESKCIGCKLCLKTGCPSLGFKAEDKKAVIDLYTCVGCDVCARECPVDAIVRREM